MATQKTLVTKVVGNEKMNITAKNGVNIQNFAIELAQTKLNWLESQVKSYLVAYFVKSLYAKPWYDMFGIFPSYYITYHESMHWFSIFFYFFYFLCSHFKSRSNSRYPPCVLGGWGPLVWDGLWGSTPLGHLQVFSAKIFEVQFM
jgi:hypothetical protein